MGYLLSIVVPTKDRYYYLKHLILLIHSFNSNEIELVIQDNTADNTEILEFIENEKFNHLKYFHSTESLSVSQNSDKAILNSTGEYVCCIGDDDGVVNSIVEACRWMQQNSVDCLTCKGFYYRWPDSISSSRLKGSLEVSYLDFAVQILNTQEVLEDLLDRGMVDRGNLPLVYHGIIKRTTLDEVWEKCGSYFPGASPDIANGIALCLVAEKVAISTIPYAYSGASQHLGGGASKLKHHATTDFKSLPFLPSNIETIWDKRVPKVWAACSIWCESAIEAMNKMERHDLIQRINFEALYAEFVSSFFYYRTYAYRLTNNKLLLFFHSTMRSFSKLWDRCVGRVKRDILKIENSVKVYTDLKDISAANALIDNLMKKHIS